MRFWAFLCFFLTHETYTAPSPTGLHLNTHTQSITVFAYLRVKQICLRSGWGKKLKHFLCKMNHLFISSDTHHHPEAKHMWTSAYFHMAGLRGFFSVAVVNICKRVPKVGRWPNGGEPDSSTSVPDSAKEKLNDSAGVDPPAPLRCSYHIAKARHNCKKKWSVLVVNPKEVWASRTLCRTILNFPH